MAVATPSEDSPPQHPSVTFHKYPRQKPLLQLPPHAAHAISPGLHSPTTLSKKRKATPTTSVGKKPKVTQKAKTLLERAIKRFQQERRQKAKEYHGYMQQYGLFHIGVSETQGARAYMEDRYTIIPNLHTFTKQQHSTTEGLDMQATCSCFCAVYDGHNGERAAEHASKRLHDILAQDPTILAYVKDLQDHRAHEHLPSEKIQQAITEAFEQVEREIMQLTMDSGNNDGATALMCLILGEHLFIANIGDSRAVLAREGEKEAQRLSVDHKPDIEDEKLRIVESGGKVIFSGCWRVAHDHVPVRLAVSRSFGDHQLKSNLPTSCIAPLVSAEPHVHARRLTKEDQFIILASDGVWDRLTDDEAIAIVREEFDTHRVEELGEKDDTTPRVGWTPSKHATKAAAQKLIETALNRRSFDNVTAIVLAFPQ